MAAEVSVEIEARIQRAIEKMSEEEKPNIAATAREMELPEHRLRARWKGRQSRHARIAPNRKLSQDEELALCQYLNRLDEIGVPARYRQIGSYANEILARAHTDSSIPVPTVSHMWTRRFLERHPEYLIRKQKTLDVKRKQAHNRDDLYYWFERYQKIRDERGILPTDTYNFDETGFRIGIGRDQWVVTRDSKRPLFLASSSNQELVTVIETISGDGAVLPPMIIVPGMLQMEDWFTKTNLPGNVLLGVSETGYSNDVLAIRWLHHFEKYSAQRQLGAWRLLLLDGHNSHCTREFIEFCDNRKIILFCLPSHCTHLLQPLDVVVFQPYKHYHSEAIEIASRTGCFEFDKIEFLTAMDSIRRQTFKPTTILSAFRETGLIPFNPSTVLDKLPPTNNSASEPELHSHSTASTNFEIQAPYTRFPHGSPPHTPPPQPEVDPITPQTIRSLKSHAQLLHSQLNQSPQQVPGSNSLKKYLKGSLALAQSGAQALSDLENTKAAQLARAVRQNRSRRSIQKGGVLYAHEARAMVLQKEKDSQDKILEKAQRMLDSARKAEENKIKKQWREISKDMRKAVKEKGKKHKHQTLLFREISGFILKRSQTVTFTPRSGRLED